MNNYGDLFNNSESFQNKRTRENIEVLDDIFKNSVGERIFEDTSKLGSIDDFYNGHSENKSSFGLSDDIQKNESSIDSFEKTSEIGSVDLETLRNYSRMLHEQIDEPKETTQSSGANNKGKVLVKTSNNNPFRNSLPEDKPASKDMSEILQAFISCSILSFVTAGMGVGWLLYIIMHI